MRRVREIVEPRYCFQRFNQLDSGDLKDEIRSTRFQFGILVEVNSLSHPPGFGLDEFRYTRFFPGDTGIVDGTAVIETVSRIYIDSAADR